MSNFPFGIAFGPEKDAKDVRIEALQAENEMLTAENRTLRNVGITQQETIERLRARVEVLEGALMEIRQAAEDNNLMPDYIIALTMIAATEQEGELWQLILNKNCYKQSGASQNWNETTPRLNTR